MRCVLALLHEMIMSTPKVQRALQFRYIDEKTSGLTVDLLFSNTPLSIYGQFHLSLVRTPAGQFAGEAKVWSVIACFSR